MSIYLCSICFEARKAIFHFPKEKKKKKKVFSRVYYAQHFKGSDAVIMGIQPIGFRKQDKQNRTKQNTETARHRQINNQRNQDTKKPKRQQTKQNKNNAKIQ